ncbi:hypothetical protein FACS189468_2590 [Spirochaetia bacterium]|nr:hypothetical protein FACS189468_2590 [Spirochaetia bacterium]
MPKAGERAYVYAKACGIIGKSFIGKRISALNPITRLSELDRLLFAQHARELPERELLADLEKRIIQRGVERIIAVVSSFSKPPELLRLLIRSYEYSDLKGALSALAGGETKAPSFTNLGSFGTVHFEAWPDLKAMLRGTEFDFILNENLVSGKEEDSIILQTRLDQVYYSSLWKALFALPKSDRTEIQKILAEEISLRNVVWALRLRTYYGMSPEEVQKRLVFLDLRGGESRGDSKKRHSSLADDALASLSMALDTRSDWVKWRRVGLLNGGSYGEPWNADPRYFQNAASDHLYHMARLSFRRRPFSIDTAACFIKLKQFEEDLLTSVAEGLGLGMSARDVFGVLELEP